ncbi:hypothetical protein [Allorhodopirellula heiligendammensis]|uniref:Uncharacterized protein n=1 Tax=Allorhodopirellula heiligendammensis TaxID=2714739 RepID=A0A5C6C7U1_9BACT|nr:hypothetical protein [Allorhodopirellula heiligendammensis]TWU19496.1 hypothetical protein Poly21_16690 [Allorhodopirellula heiligendammensis]
MNDQRSFRVRLVAGAMFLLLSVSALASRTCGEDTFDVAFKQIDEDPRPGPLYRVKLALSPKFISMFGDAQDQSKVLRFVRTRLSLRNPEVAQLASQATPFTSEDEAKVILAKITAKYGKIAEDTELELQVATSAQQWDSLKRAQVGLLGPLFVSDKQLVEFFELTEDQEKSLREIASELNAVQQGVESADAARSRQEIESLERMKAIFDDKQNALLQRCLVESRELAEYEEQRMSAPDWLSGR